MGNSAGRVAAAYLNSRLDSGHWLPGTKLPSLDALSADAGVSRSTMWQALQVLKRGQRLTGRRGSGVFVGSAPEPAAKRPTARMRAWERTRGLLEHDIASGCYRAAAALPAAKLLQERYGVDGRTLRRALDALVGEGLLACQRRLHRIERPALPSSASIVLLTLQDPARAQVRVTSSFALLEFVRAMEAECSLRGLALRVSSQLSATGRRRTFTTPQALGYVLWEYGPQVEHTLAILAQERKPVVIIDNTSRSALLQQFAARNPLATVYRFDEDAAGAAAGRLLLQRGCRSAVFVSPVHATYYSQRRLQGLRSVMAAEGVTCEACTQDGTIADLHAATLARLPAASRVALAAGRTGPAARWSDAWFAAIFAAYQAAMEQALRPLLARARALRHADAWVCVNDHVALAAKSYLQAAGVGVPRQVGLVGFDNSSDALYSDLTSYSHSIQNLASDMLTRMVAPQRRASAGATVVHTGHMVPRATTR